MIHKKSSLFLVILFILLWAFPAIGMEKPCKNLYRKKQFLKAARCFEALLPQIDKNPNLNSFKKLLKDRFLRHAAISYEQAARRESQPAQKAYYRELAIKLLKHSFQKGYCEAAQRCRSNQLLIDNIEKLIAYSRLLVITGDKKATVEVSGPHYRQKTRELFNERLPPGPYKILIHWSKTKMTTKQITLQPRRSMTLNITPTKIILKEKHIYIAKKIPPLVITSYIIGALSMVGGGALMLYSITEQNRLNEIRRDPKRAREMSDDEYNSSFEKAQFYMIIGAVVLGLGVAVGLLGMGAHISAKGSQKTKLIKLTPIASSSNAVNPFGKSPPSFPTCSKHTFILRWQY